MNEIISRFAPITLEEMSSIRLMNRTDTKFVTSVGRLWQLLQAAEGAYRIQEIDGKRNMSYATVYFDTDDYQYCMGEALTNPSLQKNRMKQRVRQIMKINSGNVLSTIGNLLKVNREEMCAMQRTCVLVALMGLFATVGYAQQSDFGVWATVGADKKLSKQWSLAGELGLRTRDNSKEMDRYHLGLEADYKPWRFLKMTVGYNFLYDNRPDKVTYHKDGTENKMTSAYWWPRHRFLAGVTGSYSLGNLDLSLREMYQYTYRPKASDKKYDTDTEEWEDVKSKSQSLLRSRLQLTYRLRRTPLTPFGSVELYHGDGGLQKTRYTLGSNIKIAKHHDLKFYYRYQDLRSNDDDDLDTHVLGIGYTYAF